VAFSITLPLTSTEAGQTPTIYQDNWCSITDFISTEHSPFTSSTSGDHLPGVAGVMMEGTTAAITAISTAPGSGSLAFDTTVGAWLINGSGDDDAWKSIHRAFPTTRIQASMSADTTPTSGVMTIIPFHTETLDSLGEYNAATYAFSAKDAGYFFVTGHVLCKTSTTSGGDTITLTLSGSYATYRTISKNTLSSEYETIGISTIAYVPSAGTLAFYFTAPSNKTTTLSSGAGNSYLRIHRVS
jgi:hypothetical protein